MKSAMRIILNSDILHMTRLLTTGLAKHIDEFCREAAQSGAVLALPRTVILEHEHQQQALAEKEVAKLDAAASLLSQWRVSVPGFSARDLIHRVDLTTALQATGIAVEVHDPTLDDYRDAERRASFHLAPQAPDAKSDEMRDLVIWAVALRIAKQDSGAMLVSRDQIHVDKRGSQEAESAGLRRASTLDDALDLLGRVSRVGALTRSVLATVWDALKAAGLPLPDDVPSRRFSNRQFAADEQGHANTMLSFEIVTSQGRLACDAHIFQATPVSVQADLKGLSLEGLQWGTGLLSVTANRQLPTIAQPAADRMTDLRANDERRQ
jgi:hypothetical protein